MVRQGYKQTEVGEIPEDWLVEPLENFTSFISYGFTNPMPAISDGIFMITAKDINKGRIQFESARCTTEFAYKNFLTGKSRPHKNDVLLTKDGTLGRLALVGNETVCINQSVALLRPNDRIVPLFFKTLLESSFYQGKMLDDAGGSTIKHIYITIVNKMLLGLPKETSEQNSIANALSDVDELIVSLEKLIAKKRDIKTATMQQLLTGKKRLPGFGEGKGYKQTELGEIPEDWEVKSLHEFASVKGGKRLPKGSKLQVEQSSHPYIRVADMFVGGIDLSDIHYVPLEIAQTIKNYTISTNDLFISVAGTLGIVGFIPEILDGANLTENADKITNILIDKSYLFYCLISERIQTEIFVQSTVGAQPKLAINKIENFKILLPSQQSEQRAISKVLSDIESEIALLESRLSKIKAIKQGMMQELLTGRTRLLDTPLYEEAEEERMHGT